MAKVICGGFQSAVGASATGYTGIGLSNHSATTVETLHDQTIRTAGTFSNLSCTVLLQGTGASTLRLRKNLNNLNQSISIPGSTTGFFEDTSNTDSVVAGDELDFQLVSGSGGTTTVVPFVLFEATGNTTAIYGGTRALSFSTASATRFISLVSRPSGYAETVEADAQIKIKEAGTWKNMDIKLSSNTRSTTTTWTSRINGVDGNMLVSVPAVTTGHFEDTSNTDAVSVDDLLAIKMVTGTGAGAIDPETQKTEIEYSGDIFNMPSGQANDGVRAVPFNTTEYHLPIGISASSTESLRQIVIPTPLRFTNLQVHVITNTITGSASTVKVRKNSADGNGLVSVPAGATGFFEDTVNSDSFVDGDKMAYEIITPNTSGTLSISTISTTGEEFILSEIDETFTVDALLQATIDETFAVDAKIAFRETFLVDAILKATIDETFLVDAFIQALGDNGCSAIFQDNFSTATNWTEVGSGDVTITGGVIDGWGPGGSSLADNRLTHDLGSTLSDTLWKAEFEYIFTASNLASHPILYFTDKDQDPDATSDNDEIGVVHGSGVDELKIVYVDNGDIGASGISSSGIPISSSTTYYPRLERLSSTLVRLSVYSDVGRTTHIASSPVTLTVTSTTDGLRYVQSSNPSQGSVIRTLTGTLDNLAIDGGCPTFEVDAFIQELGENGNCGYPDFFDNFTSDLGWSFIGSRVFLTIPDVLEATQADATFKDQGTLDIGTTLSNTEWVMRFKFDITAFTAGSLAGNARQTINFLLSDSTADVETNSDFIGFRWETSSSINRFQALDGNGQEASNINDGVVDDTSSITPSVKTFYVEMKRTTANAYSIEFFNDAGFTSSIDTINGASATGTASLDTIKIQSFNGIDVLIQNDGVMDTEIDDIEIWDGVTSLPSASGTVACPTVDAILQTLGDGSSCTSSIYTDDMSSATDWISTDTTPPGFADITGGVLSWEGTADGSNDTIATDLSLSSRVGKVLDDTSFRVRFKQTYGSVGLLTHFNHEFFHVSDSDQTVNAGTGSEDAIGFHVQIGGGSPSQVVIPFYKNGSSTKVQAVGTLHTISTGSTFFYEIIRNSATSVTWNVYSDPFYTALVATLTDSAVPASVGGLKYFKGGNWAFGNIANLLLGSVDDLEILTIGTTGNVGCADVDAILVILFTTEEEEFFVDARLSALEEFTVDARLSALVEFAVDTFSQAEKTETFFINAILKATFTETFDINAILKATQIFNFTVDGLLSITPSELYCVDALIQDTFDEDFIVDSRLSALEEFLVDASIVRNKLFTLDAFPQATFDEDFTVNGVVIKRIEKTFLVDGLIQEAPQIPLEFIVDARIVRQIKFDIDAVVRYAQGSQVGSFGAIPDLIIRVLRENGTLTGRGIVDEIVIITTAENFPFRGKTSRIKNWLNRLRLDGLIQEDGSDPDWFETIWSLV